MTKAEQSKILEELIAQVQLAKFKDDVILMTQMMATDFQIQLMQKLMASLSPRQQAYPGLKAQVDVAVADFRKLVS
jgi:hypothetical protein